ARRHGRHPRARPDLRLSWYEPRRGDRAGADPDRSEPGHRRVVRAAGRRGPGAPPSEASPSWVDLKELAGGWRGWISETAGDEWANDVCRHAICRGARDRECF